MKFRRPKTTKICPRCGNKCLLAQEKCDDCGLLFSRLQYASNKAAKRKIAHFDSDFVICTKDYPSDLKWWKVLLMTIFTGLFGGHFFSFRNMEERFFDLFTHSRLLPVSS